MRPSMLVTASVLLLVAAACSSSVESSPPPSSPTTSTIDDYVAADGEGFCRWSVRCGFSPDVAACSEVLGESADPQLDAAVASGRVVFDADQGSRCAAAWDTDSCDPRQLRNGDAECTGVFTGTQPAGASCFLALECVGALECDLSACNPDTTCCAGVCAPLLTSGEPCSSDTVDCDTGTACSDILGGTCVALAPAGAPCQFDDNCQEGLTCQTDSMSTESACASPSEHGAACDPAKLSVCALYTDVCDATQHVCRTATPGGGSCDATAPWSECVSWARCTDGTCVGLGVPGDACNDLTDCLDALDCNGNKCSAPPAPAAPCSY